VDDCCPKTANGDMTGVECLNSQCVFVSTGGGDVGDPCALDVDCTFGGEVCGTNGLCCLPNNSSRYCDSTADCCPIIGLTCHASHQCEFDTPPIG
jgi:hypothetical protein